MGSFDSVNRSGKRFTGDRTHGAKLAIRRNVLAAIGAERAHVFDAFAGPGEMHREVWSQASSYTGCDERWYRDARRCFVGDNRLVMRAIDLRPFNVFDLDSFGSPWEQLAILAHRRPLATGETVGLVLTEGSGLKLKTSGVPLPLAWLCGLEAAHLKLANRAHDTLIEKALAKVLQVMGGRVVARWQAKNDQRASMRYVGLVIEAAAQASSGS